MLFLWVDWGERHHDLSRLLDPDGNVLATHRVVYQEHLAWPATEAAV
jgi:hypothetical protein